MNQIQVDWWTLGYNDFSNLDMQTLWWLPNKILRHIHKKIFSVFLSRILRICNQSLQKVLIRAKKIFYQKIQYGYKRTQNFESVEKVLKKCTIKKLLAKIWRKKALFSLFSHVLQTFVAYNFFRFLVHFFTTFSTDSKSAWNSAFFDIFSDFFAKNFFWVILALFANFEAERAKKAQKFKKTYLVNVS